MDSLHSIEKDLNEAVNFVFRTAKVDSAEKLNHTVFNESEQGPSGRLCRTAV